MEYIAVCSGFKILRYDSTSKDEVFDRALEAGFYPVLILRNYLKSNKVLSNKEAANFFESLYFLFKSTSSMTKSLKFLEDKYDKTSVKTHYNSPVRDYIDRKVKEYQTSRYRKRLNLVKDLREKIERGYALSQCLKEHNFDEISVGLIMIAEEGGDYEKTFKTLSNYYSTKEKYSKNLMKELAYPLVLVLAAITAFFIFVFIVIPAFSNFFKGLPVAKSTLTTISIFMNIRNYFYIYGGFIAGAIIVLLYLWLSNYRGVRTKFFEKVATIPIIGYFFRFSYLKWYLYEMSVLISAGKTYDSIVKYLMDSAKIEFFKDRWTVVYLHLAKGFTLFESFKVSDLLRPEDLDRVSAAEIGGGVDNAMMQISKEYEEIVDLQMKVINKILNYSVLLMIAAFIVFVVLGIYLPMIRGVMSISGARP